MTNLENRIRNELHDPHWILPTWPDPMQRVRRAARLRLAQLTVVALIVAAVLVTPFAVARTIIGGQQGGSRPSAAGSSGTHRSHSQHISVPSFAKHFGGEVAYKCGDRICLMRPDGTGRRTLLATFPESDPAWSPDGRTLAFRGYFGIANGDYAIYSVQPNGCQLRRVPHSLQGSNPTWSPTGRQIAFVPAGESGIEILNADGTGIRALARGTHSETYLLPSWSARNVIAFVRTSGSGPGQIYTVRPDGSGLRQLTHGAGFSYPSWSPSGRLIAFVTDSGAIEVAKSNGNGAHTVSPGQWVSGNPAWTPGGKLVFQAERGSHTRTYVVNPSGTGLRRLYLSLEGAQSGPAQIAWGAASLPTGKCSPS